MIYSVIANIFFMVSVFVAILSLHKEVKTLKQRSEICESVFDEISDILKIQQDQAVNNSSQIRTCIMLIEESNKHVDSSVADCKQCVGKIVTRLENRIDLMR